ncbi:MAG: radical SAM family heme chaperone HemW [Rickettsiales bacterium]|nr:radical SAM family heme chaperone HemW [Rickettsiales bacterium]
MELGLYIHYPYCLSKCPYCDFNSHVAKAIDSNELVHSYVNELSYYKNLVGDDITINTIFFGGGTPSLMDNNLISKLLDHIRSNYHLSDNIEITLEANPSTIENNKIAFFHEIGINRISLGVQSFDEEVLKFLGRKHDVKTAVNALENIQKYFNNFSLDLIYGIHNQNLDDWKNNLKTAFSYNSNHISLYQLTIEKGTEFFRRYNKNQLKVMNEDLQADLYDFTFYEAEKNGYNRYEISNFAKKGFESKHNLNYWQSGDYIGIGAGAHSRLTIKNKRYGFINYHKPEKWSKSAMINNSIQSKELLSLETQIDEYIMMGLRLRKGININDFNTRFKVNFFENINIKNYRILINDDFLKFENNHVRITQKNLKLINNILSQLLS